MTAKSDTGNLGACGWLVRWPQGAGIRELGKWERERRKGDQRCVSVLVPTMSNGAQWCWGSSAEQCRICLRVFPLKDGKWVCIPCLPSPISWNGGPRSINSPELLGQPANMSWDRKAEISEVLELAHCQCAQNCPTELQLNPIHWPKETFQPLSPLGLPSPNHSLHCLQNNLSYVFIH